MIEIKQNAGWRSIVLSNYKILNNGQELELLIYYKYYPATHDSPEEEISNDEQFFIEGQSVDRDKLPREVTDEVIAELRYFASACAESTLRRLNPEYL